ncbi:MAG: radical SAM/SPASM domain-containing protein [Pseudobdellovibrio sp.]
MADHLTTPAEKLPLAIEIEINSDCNLSCAYCPNSKAERVEKGHMSPIVFETLMKQLQKHNFGGRISFHFYNEPTLSPNLDKFVQMSKSYLPNARTVLYTNGTQLNEQRVAELHSIGLDRFNVTEHHQVKLENLNYMIQEDGYRKMDDKFKFSTFKMIPMTNRGGVVKAGKRLTETLNTPCFIPRCVLVVSLQGNVIACYEDYFQKHVMGNILKQDIMDIWMSEKYTHFREELKKGNRALFEVCKTCNNQMIIV